MARAAMVIRARVGTALNRRNQLIPSAGRNHTEVPAKKSAKKASAPGRLCVVAARTPAATNGGQR